MCGYGYGYEADNIDVACKSRGVFTLFGTFLTNAIMTSTGTYVRTYVVGKLQYVLCATNKSTHAG